MLKESVTNKEQVLVFTWESALMNDKVALIMTGVIEILLRVDLENVVRHLETNWLNLLSNAFTFFIDVAESFITSAIKIW